MDEVGAGLKAVEALRRQGRRAEALAAAHDLASRDLGGALNHARLANLFLAFERFGEADRLYARAGALERGNPDIHYNRATVQRVLGDVAGAEASCDRVLALRPGDAGALLLRSSLRQQSEAANHLADLEMARKGAADPAALSLISYALAKELEDLGQYDLAFAAMQTAGEARRGLIAYDIAADEQILAAIAETYGPERFERTGQGWGEADPVFIIGLPRTGTTLVERILTRTGQIGSAGERSDFAIQLARLSQGGAGEARLSASDLVRRSAQIDFSELGRAYVEGVRRETGLEGRFVDKLPLNFLYAGLIALALPRARIVHVTRHPLDTCLAIYKQSFDRLYPFSYRLEEIARYYVAYDRLMRHWRSVAPARLLTLSYEALVAEPERVGRELCDYCQTPWTPSRLDLANHPGPVTTASAVQARRAIYADSVGSWRCYAGHLVGARRILEAAGIAVDKD